MNKKAISIFAVLLIGPLFANARFSEVQFECDAERSTEGYSGTLTGTVTNKGNFYELVLNATGAELACMRGSTGYDCEPIEGTEFKVKTSPLAFQYCSINGPVKASENEELFGLWCNSFFDASKVDYLNKFELSSNKYANNYPTYSVQMKHLELAKEDPYFQYNEDPKLPTYNQTLHSCKITKVTE